MADSEKAPEQQQQAPAKTEGSKNDNASNPPTSEEQQPKQIIGEFKKNRQTDRTRVIQRDANENQIILSQTKTKVPIFEKKRKEFNQKKKNAMKMKARARTRQLINRFNAINYRWELDLIRCVSWG